MSSTLPTDPVYRDACGVIHPPLAAAPARIVSLVPSLTELLVDLGLAGQLVGRTGFCIHPREVVRHLPKVGGTKGFDLDKLRALAPTHVLVNIDENRRDEVEALRDFVPHLVVTHPLGPLDNPLLYRLLGSIFCREAQAEGLCQAFAHAWARLQQAVAARPRARVLYLIWKDPWMSVAGDTYIARMLAAAGWDNVLPDSPDSSDSPERGRQSLAAPLRYPCVPWPEALAGVDRVLLPSEPYHFVAADAKAVAGEAALAGRPVTLVDGEMISWYGSRAVAGLDYLRELRQRLG